MIHIFGESIPVVTIPVVTITVIADLLIIHIIQLIIIFQTLIVVRFTITIAHIIDNTRYLENK
tara:strand:- start:1365 stop:1553 length:189 start_codon:yes stop_codon:yes gene_type:complete